MLNKLESAEEAYRRALRVSAEAGTTSEFDSINVTVTYNLARLLIRLLTRRTYRAPFIAEPGRPPVLLNFMEQRFSYLEYNPAMRIGMLKGGAQDVLQHGFCSKIEVDKLLKRELPAPYTPKVKGFDDLSNFDKFPADGGETAASVKILC